MSSTGAQRQRRKLMFSATKTLSDLARIDLSVSKLVKTAITVKILKSKVTVIEYTRTLGINQRSMRLVIVKHVTPIG
jgi:hypothetical protein